ncbi:hypothetical protein Golomagni_04306 [Golovinomyces magnicellulatus]|nr:hypothetical protein Golomagni_04306 [Golovinomyces magnicellulatus]
MAAANAGAGVYPPQVGQGSYPGQQQYQAYPGGAQGAGAPGVRKALFCFLSPSFALNCLASSSSITCATFRKPFFRPHFPFGLQ